MEFNATENCVWVKLTKVGLDELRKRHDQFLDRNANVSSSFREFRPPKTDSEGWSCWQLIDLMHTFGHLMSVGSKLPFESNIRVDTV